MQGAIGASISQMRKQARQGQVTARAPQLPGGRARLGADSATSPTERLRAANKMAVWALGMVPGWATAYRMGLTPAERASSCPLLDNLLSLSLLDPGPGTGKQPRLT